MLLQVGSLEWRLSYSMSGFLFGRLRSVVSHDSSLSSSLPRSIAVFLVFVYSAGASVVPKDNRRQRKSSLSTIEMRVDLVLAFACIRR